MPDPFDPLPLAPSGVEPSPDYRSKLRARLHEALEQVDSAPGTLPASPGHAASRPGPVIGAVELDRARHAFAARGSRRRLVALAGGLLVVVAAAAAVAGRDQPDLVEIGEQQSTVAAAATTGPSATGVPTSTTVTPSMLPAGLVTWESIRAKRFVALPHAAPFEFGCGDVLAPDAVVTAAASVRDADTAIAPERLHQWVITFPTADAASAFVGSRLAATRCATSTVVLPGDAQVSDVTAEAIWSAADGFALRLSGNPYGPGQSATFGALRGPVAVVQLVVDRSHVWMLLHDEAVGGGGPPPFDAPTVAEAARSALRSLG